MLYSLFLSFLFLSFLFLNELTFCLQALCECSLNAFAIHFQVGLIFGNALFLDVLISVECVLFFSLGDHQNSTRSSGLKVHMVSC